MLKFRNNQSHLLQVCLGVRVKIETVIENHSVKVLVIVIIDLKHYPCIYCLMQCSCFMNINF